MKLQIPKQCQRDPRWANIILGFNVQAQYNIGMYGCLITCFSMYLAGLGKDENPGIINEELKNNNGFTPGTGNLIWSAIPRVYSLADVYQSPTYTGPVTDQGLAKMKSFLDAGQPLVTHIDFNPATTEDDQHWVLVNGYDGDIFYCNDPWSGNNVSLDVYGGVKRAVVQFRAYDKTLPQEVETVDLQAELDKVRMQRDENWNTITAVAEPMKIQPVREIMVAEVNKLISYEDVIQQKNSELILKTNDITALQAKTEEMTKEVDTLSSSVTDAQKTIDAQSVQIETQRIQLNDQQKTITDLTGRLESLKTDLQIVLNKAIDGISWLELIKMGIQKFFGWIQ